MKLETDEVGGERPARQPRPLDRGSHNRTLKDATVKRYFYETHDQFRSHLTDFVRPII